MTEETLDAEELLHLALKSIEEGRDAETLSLVKRAIALQPENGVLHHLLGAAYAEIGLPDRAKAEWTLALRLAPELKVCRFQLGLLHYTAAEIEMAAQVWEPLSQLPPDHHLALFRSGLLALVSDDYEKAAQDLIRGIELNTDHPSLNNDIRMLIELAEQAVDEAIAEMKEQEEPAAEPEAPAADPARHVLLSGYPGLAGEKK